MSDSNNTVSKIEEFTLPSSQEAVNDLRERLRRTRWPDEIADEAAGQPWAYGVDRSFLVELCEYWRDGFDWKAQVERMNRFKHYTYRSRWGKVHFIHAKGVSASGESVPMPLVLTHGWPGSFVEMLEIIPLLTDPAAHGGDERDAFDVVVPSLPGFGFSEKPTVPGMSSWRVAEMWAELMQELGYERFAAQGGDIGAGVSTALGLRHGERMIGVHLNFIPSSYRPQFTDATPLTESEQRTMAYAVKWRDENGAYAQLQSTRPQTPAYALNDSPAGLAAWIVEKFREWSDCKGDVYSRFTRDELLTNVTLYWMTETIGSSFRMYYENRRAPMHFGPGERIQVPCAVARFPGEILYPPREW